VVAPAKSIDLSADVGEDPSALGRAVDAALIAAASTAHIAAGGHVGHADSIRRTIDLCCEAGVVVGAHPSYPDRAGFGRQRSSLVLAEVVDSVLDQLFIVSELAATRGARLESIKPHGQLYHDLESDEELAESLFEALASLETRPRLVLQCGTRRAALARRAGLELVAEGFCDRRYDAGGLVARGEPGALLAEPSQAASQAVELAREGLLLGGARRAVDSLCVHSDTPEAAVIMVGVRRALEASALAIRAPQR
jgi:UPF0271 protein